MTVTAQVGWNLEVPVLCRLCEQEKTTSVPCHLRLYHVAWSKPAPCYSGHQPLLGPWHWPKPLWPHYFPQCWLRTPSGPYAEFLVSRPQRSARGRERNLRPSVLQRNLFPVVAGSRVKDESCAWQSSSFRVYLSEKSCTVVLWNVCSQHLTRLISMCKTLAGFSFRFCTFLHAFVLHCQWTTELPNPSSRFIFLRIIKRGASNLVALCCMLIMLTAFTMLLFFQE